jgi:hypothetical protein
MTRRPTTNTDHKKLLLAVQQEWEKTVVVEKVCNGDPYCSGCRYEKLCDLIRTYRANDETVQEETMPP